MKKKKFLDRIKEIISKAELSTAFTETIEYFKKLEDTVTLNDLTVLFGKYNNNEKKYRNGFLIKEVFDSELTRINYAFLNIIDRKIEIVDEHYTQGSEILGHIIKLDILTSGLKSGDYNIMSYSKEKPLTNIKSHIAYTNAWAETILFRDLKKEKSTLQTYIDLDYYVIPKSLQVEDEKSEKINLLSIFNYTKKHIIILGQPGAGKTTTMKRLIQFITKNENKVELQKFKNPVVIRLREWNDFKHKSLLVELLSIYGFIINDEEAFNREIIKTYYYNYIARFIDRLNILLVLDGLDELRSELKGSLLSELKELSRKLDNSRIIITSRPGEHIRLENTFKEFEICPLSNDQINEFIEKWLKNPIESEKLKKQIKNSPFEDTITRPLTLSHLCALFERNKKIPTKPKTIYRKIVNLLLEEWDDQRGITRNSKYSDFEPDRKLEFLSYLAFVITTEIKKTSFLKKELQNVYRFICKNFDLPEKEEKIVIGELESHTGIFINSGYEKFEFAHKSTQEFLTAEYIVKLPSFPKKELIYLVPNELALANSITTNPTDYFSILVFSRFLNEGLALNFLEVFFRRLILEKPEFYPNLMLGISYISLLNWVILNNIETNDKNVLIGKIMDLNNSITNSISAFDNSIQLVTEYYEIILDKNLDKMYIIETCNSLNLNREDANSLFKLRDHNNIVLLGQKKRLSIDSEYLLPKYLLFIKSK